MKSRIYEGTVVHARQHPQHQFQYRLFMMFVDLDELPQLFERRWFWSERRPNLAWFRRQDYFGDPQTDLGDSIRELVQERTGSRPAGSIRLLTNLRYFGFLINPISLYYCYNEGDELEYVVAEVTNTPWGERHSYVLDFREGKQCKDVWEDKALHVSPFMDMDYQYRFLLSEPSERLSIRIENHRPGVDEQRPSFFAAMTMKSVPIGTWSLSRVLFRYPAMTLQIAVAIYWQALRLYLKGATFFVHPGKQNQSTQFDLAADSESEVRFERELESTA